MGDVPARVDQIRCAGAAWAHFWAGHLDLDALAWDVSEHLTDMAIADARIDRATAQAQRYWEQLYGDDPLLGSVPGVGPVIARTIRGFLIDGTGFTGATQVCSYVGMTPSNWSSGSTVDHRGRAITKEGPAVLRLAFYQAANIARTRDPQQPSSPTRLLIERGHCHTQATVAVGLLRPHDGPY